MNKMNDWPGSGSQHMQGFAELLKEITA